MQKSSQAFSAGVGRSTLQILQVCKLTGGRCRALPSQLAR